MQLREYQKKAVAEVFSAWQSGTKRLVLTLPTGGGKTVIAVKIVEHIIESNRRVLLFVNRAELLRQTVDTMRRIGIEPSLLSADEMRINSPAICIAMQATMRKRLKKNGYLEYFKNFTHVIIDECHYGDYDWIFKFPAFKDTYFLGLTATPISADKKKPLRTYYHQIIEPVSVKELIDIGSLVPARFFACERDLSSLLVRGGEYTESSQEEVFAGQARYEDVVAKYNEFCAGRKCIVFNTTQKMAVELAQTFNKLGVKADYLISGNEDFNGVSDRRRRKILDEFCNGDLMVLSNTAILTAGFDAPVCSAIILNYATMRRTKYFQCIGRGARPYPGKKDFIVLDFGENYFRFGLFDMMWERKGKVNRIIDSWAQLFYNPDVEPKQALPPVKDCPQCKAMLPIQTRICPNCGYEFLQKEKEIASVSNFIEVSLDVSPEKMIRKWIYLALTKDVGGENFVLKKIRENLGINGLRLYASLVGRESSWVDAYCRNRKERLWADIVRTFPIKSVQDFIAADIRKQLAGNVDFFKIELAYREKVLAHPDEFLRKYFLGDE